MTLSIGNYDNENAGSEAMPVARSALLGPYWSAALARISAWTSFAAALFFLTAVTALAGPAGCRERFPAIKTFTVEDRLGAVGRLRGSVSRTAASTIGSWRGAEC